jgi:hypothetical protein
MNGILISFADDRLFIVCIKKNLLTVIHKLHTTIHQFKRPPGRPRCRWNDKIKDLMETGINGVN